MPRDDFYFDRSPKGPVLPLTFQSVLDMQPNYDSATFDKKNSILATKDEIESREMSEDVILDVLQYLIKSGQKPSPAAIITLRSVLARNSMDGSPKRIVFEKALRELDRNK